MSITYAPGTIEYIHAASLGVAFRRSSVRGADGSIGDSQWFRHAEGGWDNEFDPAIHVRRMTRLAARPNRQEFAIPMDALVAENAKGEVFVLDDSGAIASDHDMLHQGHMATLLGLPAAAP